MILAPFTKKIEIDAGYRGFYVSGIEKITITVVDNGIEAIVDTNLRIPGSSGELKKLFKPMGSLFEGKKYAEGISNLSLKELENNGFVLFRCVGFSNERSYWL